MREHFPNSVHLLDYKILGNALKLAKFEKIEGGYFPSEKSGEIDASENVYFIAEK
jgi:hypothetical protein